MKFDISKIEFSKRDREKGIILPSHLTEELAEDIGIHTGDGSLYLCNKWKTCREFCYSFNAKEKDYLKYVSNYKKNLYNIPKVRLYSKAGEIGFKFNSLAITNFYKIYFNIPIGKKTNISAPNIIKKCNDVRIISGYLRGVIDTDFSLILRKKCNKLYPSFEGTFSGIKLVNSLSKLFDKLKIKNNLLQYNVYDKRTGKTYLSNQIILSGRERVNKVLKLIKPANDKYSEKIRLMGPEGFEPLT